MEKNKIRIILPFVFIGLLIFFAFWFLNINNLVIEKSFQPFIILAFSIISIFLIKEKIVIPYLTLKQENLFFNIICISIIVELLYFGAPIFGQVIYTEFGFPIVHHISLMMWMLVLFGKQKKKNLLINTIFCLLIFNRQILLFGVLSYIMSNKIKINFKTFLITIIFLIFILAIGIYRNFVLKVDFDPFFGYINLPFLEYYDFIIFYLIGPYNASFNNLNFGFSETIFNYWNTVPEWMFFHSKFLIPESISFIIFYGLIIFILLFIKRIKSFRKFYYVPIIVIYSYFTFFSSVILSTVFVANFLMLELIFLLSKLKILPRK
jgi:hypothetical protein